MFKLVQSEEIPIDNDFLRHTLITQADASEKTVRGTQFKYADINTQLDTLEHIATQTAEEVRVICGTDPILIDADTFYIVSPSDEATGEPIFTPVDQSKVPIDERKMPIGRFDGCTFMEFLKASCTTYIDKLTCDYPSVVLTDDVAGLVYLFPIRDLKAAHLVHDTTK